MESNADKLREEFYEGMRELKERQKHLEELIDKLRESQMKTDAQIAKTDAEINKLRETQIKTDAQIAKTTEAVRRVSDGYGRFVEGIISPSAIKYFSHIGYKVEDVYHRIKFLKDRQTVAEYDTIIETTLNGKKYVLIGEAKSHCSSNDIDEFINSLHKVREIGRYSDKRIIGFIAAISYGKDANKYAIKKGLYVFKVTDDIMEAEVPAYFIPTEF